MPSVKPPWRTFKNTLAEDLIETLNQVLSIEGAEEGEDGAGERRQRRRSGTQLVYEKSRNAVLYRGNGKDWARIRILIDKLDKPVPQVLIEVLLAEVTLSGQEESGIEYLANLGIGSRGIDAQLTSGGLSMALDGAGETRALLRLAYEDNRVAIRSLPRLVVKSGESGNIFAGSQVPILSQRAEGVQVEGSTSIVQQIQYRNTGVTLDITPIVQANGLVDLEISQTFSETRAAGAASLTPTILSRNLATSMTLRDGQSVIMGGLISDTQSQGHSGVPGLGRIPVVGRLFRADSFQKDRTELVVMVIPYVIADHRQGRELTEQIKSQLELHRRFL
ncbi:MAG: type II secretion system protein GspD [Pseudomonadales bacterium]|nr:type II secretion system protein GspD [Pseudomonadales bacterium]